MDFRNILVKLDSDELYLDIFDGKFLYKKSDDGLRYWIHQLRKSDLVNIILIDVVKFENDLLNALKDLNKQHLNLLKTNDWYLVYELDLNNNRKILKLECDNFIEYDI